MITDEPKEEEMDILEHLRELRTRLIRSVVAVGLSAIIAYLFSQSVFEFLTAPFYTAFSETEYSIIGTGPAEAFLLKIKLALFLGVFLSCPFIFTQVWGFVAPGLYDHERRLFLPFVASSTVLFFGGASFCYYLVLPIALDFFQDQYASLPHLEPYIRVDEYFSLILKSLLGFGLVFELPILAYLLARAGLLTDSMMIQYARHATAGVFLISAILTPPDVFSQLLMASGLMGLYGVSIVVVRIAQKAGPLSKEKSPEGE